MSYTFARFEVSFYRLNFEDCKELEPMRQQIENVLKTHFPNNLEYDSDIEAELIMHSGTCFEHEEEES